MGSRSDNQPESTGEPDPPQRASTDPSESRGIVVRFLHGVEKVGNYLPHPFWLFVILAGVVIVLSAILEAAGIGAENPADGEQIDVQSLMTPEGFQQMITDAVQNFVEFPPLGLIITVMLGVAVAEGSGMISTAIRIIVSKPQSTDGLSAGWLRV